MCMVTVTSHVRPSNDIVCRKPLCVMCATLATKHYILVAGLVKIIIIMAVTSAVLHMSIWYNGDVHSNDDDVCCVTF